MNEVEPVYIAVEGARGAFWITVLWWSLAVAGVGTVLWVLPRIVWMRRDPLERAFSKLARQRLLSVQERAELKAMASRSGVPAAVLLISAGARARAQRSGGQ